MVVTIASGGPTASVGEGTLLATGMTSDDWSE